MIHPCGAPDDRGVSRSAERDQRLLCLQHEETSSFMFDSRQLFEKSWIKNS